MNLSILMMNKDLSQFWTDSINRINEALLELLPSEDVPLKAAMRYAVMNGGKRFRPLLVYAIAKTFNLQNEKALDYIAASIECMHSYSLVHDDLPAMDNDELRRGKPSCHVEFDEATAILSGDVLQCYAFEILAAAPVEAAQSRELILQLSRAVGFNGMALGQYQDLRFDISNAEALSTMHELKTGRLISASVLMTYSLASSFDSVIQGVLKDYGDALGLAFQICDDILDCTETTESLGKPSGSDMRNQKATYVSFFGLEGAKENLKLAVDRAKNTLSSLGEKADLLVAIADCFLAKI